MDTYAHRADNPLPPPPGLPWRLQDWVNIMSAMVCNGLDAVTPSWRPQTVRALMERLRYELKPLIDAQ